MKSFNKASENLNISDASNSSLVEHFEDAVCDKNYNPTSDPYNKSGLTYEELKIHKNEIKMVFKVPVGKKRWYEFWKKNNTEKIIIELMNRYKEEVNFDESSGEIFIPVKDSK